MMQKIIRVLALLILSISTSIAAPLDCIPVKAKVVNRNFVLEGVSSASPAGHVYFFKNTSQKSLWLDRLGKQTSTSARWSSYIRPYHWSALFLNKKEFTLSCAVIRPGKVDYMNCGQVLSVCSPTHVSPKKDHRGSSWLTEDKPWDVFGKAMVRYGSY